MATELARMKQHALNQRRKVAEVEQGIVRKALISGAAAATAFAEKKGAPVALFGVPTKLALATGFSLAEALSKGPARRMFGAIGDAELAMYTYAAVKSGGFIAGDDEDVGAAGDV